MANGSDATRFSPEGFVARDRLGALMGARFISVTPEQCVYEYEAAGAHFNPVDTLHDGALFTVMDSSQGMFVHSLLAPPYRRALTGTATIKYLAPVRAGKVVVRTTL